MELIASNRISKVAAVSPLFEDEITNSAKYCRDGAIGDDLGANG